MENNNAQEVVKIIPSVIRQQIDEGMKMDDLANHYKLPKSQIKRILQTLGLQIRKFHRPKFEIVQEEEITGNIMDTSNLDNTDIQDIVEEALDEQELTTADEVVTNDDSHNSEGIWDLD